MFLHTVYPEGLHFNYPLDVWLEVGCLSSFAFFLNIALLLKAVQIPLWSLQATKEWKYLLEK